MATHADLVLDLGGHTGVTGVVPRVELVSTRSTREHARTSVCGDLVVARCAVDDLLVRREVTAVAQVHLRAPRNLARNLTRNRLSRNQGGLGLVG